MKRCEHGVVRSQVYCPPCGPVLQVLDVDDEAVNHSSCTAAWDGHLATYRDLDGRTRCRTCQWPVGGAFVPVPLAIVEKGPFREYSMRKRRGDFEYRLVIDSLPLQHTLATFHAERTIDRALERAVMGAPR